MTSRATSPRIAPSKGPLFWPEGCIPFSCMGSSYSGQLVKYFAATRGLFGSLAASGPATAATR